MIYKLTFSNKFKKDVKKIEKRGYNLNLLYDLINNLVNGIALEPRYLLHKLYGLYEGFYECHIKPDWLLIFSIDEIEKIIYCSRTGSHSDLF